MALSMMIPIPGINTLPAMGIFVTGFGLLDDDGAISLAGIVLCLMGATLTCSILYGFCVKNIRVCGHYSDQNGNVKLPSELTLWCN
jgi:hypothetical protein